MQAHPHLELADELIRIFGWPALIAAFVWGVRQWTQGTNTLRILHENTKLAVDKITMVQGEVGAIKDNHLVHLQEGITKVAQSNDKAVEILQDIKTGITVLADRFPRA